MVAFEQLFGPGRGEFQHFNKNFPKIQMPGGLRGGMLKLRFDWYISLFTGVYSVSHQQQFFKFISVQNYPYSDDHTVRTTDTLGLKPFTMLISSNKKFGFVCAVPKSISFELFSFQISN